MFTGNLLFFSMCPLPLILSLDTTEKSLPLSSSLTTVRYLYTSARTLKPSFLQDTQSKCSQPFLTCEVLQSLHRPCGPLLDTLQYVHVSLEPGSPELGPALQLWPHQCWVVGKDHLPWPADNTPNSALDAIGILCHEGALLAYGQLVVQQDPMVLLCRAVFQPLAHHSTYWYMTSPHCRWIRLGGECHLLCAR